MTSKERLFKLSNILFYISSGSDFIVNLNLVVTSKAHKKYIYPIKMFYNSKNAYGSTLKCNIEKVIGQYLLS